MKRMLIDGMTGNMGGIEKFIYTVYKAFQTQYQIDFMTVDGHIPFEEEFLENGSRIHRITPRYVSAKTYKADIDKVFSENSYDILWFNKTTLSSIECLKSAKRHNVKKIICHSHASKNMGNFLTRIMHEFNKNKIERYVDYKLACSVEAASWFYGDKTDDVEIFNNAVDLKKYSPSLEFLIKKKKELGLEGKFVLGHIGRFSVEKNHKFLLDVFEAVSKKTDAHLVLCGEGALLSEIKEYAVQKGLGEKVSFMGVRRDIPEILQAIDVMVFPSLHEGLPFALVEAQAAGVPCVVSDTVSRDTQLTDIINYISLDEQPGQWAEKILEYKGYEKISKENQLAERGFSLETMICNIEKILNS